MVIQKLTNNQDVYQNVGEMFIKSTRTELKTYLADNPFCTSETEQTGLLSIEGMSLVFMPLFCSPFQKVKVYWPVTGTVFWGSHCAFPIFLIANPINLLLLKFLLTISYSPLYPQVPFILFNSYFGVNVSCINILKESVPFVTYPFRNCDLQKTIRQKAIFSHTTHAGTYSSYSKSCKYRQKRSGK